MKMTYTCLKIEFHQSQLNPQTYLDLMRLINHFTPQHLWGPFFSSRVSFTPKKNNKLRKHAEMVPFLLEKNKPSGFTHPFRPRFLDRSCFFPCVAAPEARPEKAKKKNPTVKDMKRGEACWLGGWLGGWLLIFWVGKL